MRVRIRGSVRLIEKLNATRTRACARDIGQDYFAVYTARSFNSIPHIRIDRAQMVPAIISRVYDHVCIIRVYLITDLWFSVRD